MLITAKTQTNIMNFVLNNHAARKQKYIRRNNKSFMTKGIQELLRKEHVLKTNF